MGETKNLKYPQMENAKVNIVQHTDGSVPSQQSNIIPCFFVFTFQTLLLGHLPYVGVSSKSAHDAHSEPWP